MSAAVRYERSGSIGVITLDRPDNRNSMTPELLDAFSAASAAARADREARVVIVTGNGASFSAGADFKSTLQRDGDNRAPNERSFAMYEPFLSLLDIAVPVIGALNGHAVGGGFGLALVCDIRVANRDARFGANFTKLGIHPGMATTYILPRLVGLPRAAELLFAGRIVSGAEAAELGMVNHAVAEAEVMPRALELAREIAGCAPIAVRWTKHSLYRNYGWDPVSAAEGEAHAQSRTFETEDSKEGVAALLEKRAPVFKGR